MKVPLEDNVMWCKLKPQFYTHLISKEKNLTIPNVEKNVYPHLNESENWDYHFGKQLALIS